MSNKKQRDLKFGAKNEDIVLDTLRTHFDCRLKKTKNCNDIFDYCYCKKGRSIKIELKTRRNAKDQYPTTMVGHNKVIGGKKLMEEGYEIYFVFKFTDGLYYYQLNENSDDECTVSKGGRRDRGRIEMKDYYFIPVELLLPIEC